MRFIPALVIAAATIIAAGCPQKDPVVSPAAPATSPSAAPAAVEDPQVVKLARVLRAADRRIVDDDLRSLAADSDPAVRARSALVLGQSGDVAAVSTVRAAVADPDAAVRAAAAFALGLIADGSTEESVESLAKDADGRVRAAAAEALGRLHAPSGGAAILALLADPDPGVRSAAGLAAWKFADPEPLLSALIQASADPEARVRVAVCYALARMTSLPFAPPSSGAAAGKLSEASLSRAREVLAGRVGDPDAEVRMQVARGLTSPRGAAELAVVGALSKDPVAGVRVNAVRALGFSGIPIKPYLERAIVDRDQSVARAAMEAVGNVGGAQAVEQLDQLVPKLENGWLREAAVLALAKADPSKTADIVDGLLANPLPWIRGSAAGLIAGHKEPGAIRAALTLLKDPSPQVQALGIPIIAGQDGPISRLLPTFFKAIDPVVRSAAADAVGDRIEHPHPAVETTDDLFARLEEIWAASSQDPIPDAKLSVLDAAGKAGKDDRARAFLTRGLLDPDVVVRRRAVARFQDAFGEDRRADIGPATNRPLADYERIVTWSRSPHTAVVVMRREGSATASFNLALDAQAAPLAAWNFAELAGKHFFNGATVHRVVPNFVVQDGDPRGDGFGGPGYSIRDEFNPLPFETGALGMASDGKDTAGSQWFITLSPQPHLDGRYTPFGRVTKGLKEIVTQMRPGDTVVAIVVDPGS
jgi:cyclophilin family peptidyl-prolyl cis-trans isomerase/HEAT repeat protein